MVFSFNVVDLVKLLKVLTVYGNMFTTVLLAKKKNGKKVMFL